MVKRITLIAQEQNINDNRLQKCRSTFHFKHQKRPNVQCTSYNYGWMLIPLLKPLHTIHRIVQLVGNHHPFGGKHKVKFPSITYSKGMRDSKVTQMCRPRSQNLHSTNLHFSPPI